MRESAVKMGQSSLKDVLLSSQGLSTEEKLRLAQFLLHFMSKSELASLLIAIAHEIDS